MNVQQLIEKLSALDPALDVMFRLENGRTEFVNEVDTAIERDPWDQDFDRTVVVLGL